MKNFDAIDFEIMVEKAINKGKSSISFQIYGCDNEWVCNMVTAYRNACAKLLTTLTALKLISRNKNV